MHQEFGAGTPIWGSYTFFFYRKWWSGVIVDPISFNISLHKITCSRNYKYQALVSTTVSEVNFYELQPWELSTSDEIIAKERINEGARLSRKKTSKTISRSLAFRIDTSQ